MRSERTNPSALGQKPKDGEPPGDPSRGQFSLIARAIVRLFLAAGLFLITVLHSSEAYGHGAELISSGGGGLSLVVQLTVEGWYYGTHLRHDWTAVCRCGSCLPTIRNMASRALRRIWQKLTGR